MLLGQNEPALVQQGLNAAKVKDYTTAITDFSQAVQLDPKNKMLFGLRGDAYLYRGRANQNRNEADTDFINAIADFTQSIAFDPTDKTAYKERAQAYASRKDYARAIDDFTQYIQLDPNNGKAYSWRGVSYLYIGDGDNALVDLIRSNQLDPNDATAFSDVFGKVCSHLAEDFAKSGDLNHAVKLENTYLKTPNLSPSDAASGQAVLARYQSQLAATAASSPVSSPSTNAVPAKP